MGFREGVIPSVRPGARLQTVVPLLERFEQSISEINALRVQRSNEREK